MATHSEDVLLQVPQVRYKKGDGVLYVMDQRIAWMLENRDTVSVSHQFQDIKMQKISPEGKPKIQLQVVLHDGSSSTFHFTNKGGSQAQSADRDRVKDLLQSLLPKFKRKVDRELEEKNKLLSTNPALLQLYKDLVITQVVTSEEFWSTHASPYMKGHSGPKQDVGVSGAFLAEIKPQTDGCNGLKYNLTSDIIDAIFKTYPTVAQKHKENVITGKMTEADFWTKFFQSHYFHRDRIASGTKDLFGECGRQDEVELRKDIAEGVKDPLMNLVMFDDHEEEDVGAKKQTSGNLVHQAMMKRFNQHTIRVLKAGQEKEETTEKQSIPEIKKRRIQETLNYDDLEDSQSDNHNQKVVLKLAKIERYLHGPLPDTVSNSETYTPDAFFLEDSSPRSLLVSPAASVSALGELSPGGALMRGFQEQSLAQLVPAEVERELRNLYMGILELLRHFWTAFPTTTEQLEQQAQRMHDALRRYQAVVLKPFEERMLRELSPLSQHLTGHLNQLLNAAYRKFSTWQQRKLTHR